MIFIDIFLTQEVITYLAIKLFILIYLLYLLI